MRIALPALFFALLATSACPGRGGPSPTGPKPPAGPSVEEDLARLLIPPGPGTAEALERLEKHADEGRIDAAWGRAHYLVDLFDDARFRRDDDSLRLLLATMGDAALTPTERGEDATAKVLSFLSAEVNRVVRLDRLHQGAQAALTLFAFAAQPPRNRSEVLQRMAEVKALANGSDAASNALLRMVGYCRHAFEDAARARWADRAQMLCHCLYPLYESNPDPYFADHPSDRPPPPHWRELGAGMLKLLDRVAALEDRLAAAAQHQKGSITRLLDDNASEMPTLPDPAALGAPLVAHAVPYDWTPLLVLGDGSKLDPVDKYAQALAMPLQGDGRGRIALAMAGHAPSSALAHALAIARAAGASRLDLLVSIRQQLSVPPGDFWHGRIEGDSATRLAVIPVAVAAEDPVPGKAPTNAPEQPIWDPKRAKIGLHLVVGPNEWRLLSAQGTLQRIATAAGGKAPKTALREALARARGAFSDEAGLVLVAGKGASYGAVLSAADAAARDDRGRALFHMLAFADEAPKPARGNALARRVERRWLAQVRIDPTALDNRSASIRSCYQDLLEKQPKLAGSVRLEVGPAGAVVVSGPRSKKLRACVLGAAGSAMSARGIASAVVELRPK